MEQEQIIPTGYKPKTPHTVWYPAFHSKPGNAVDAGNRSTRQVPVQVTKVLFEVAERLALCQIIQACYRGFPQTLRAAARPSCTGFPLTRSDMVSS